MYSRREFVKVTFAGIAAAGVSPRIAWAGVESVVRGVKIGITSGSLNPLQAVAGKDRLDVIIDQCVQLGVGNVARHDHRAGQGEAGADRPAAEFGEDFRHRPRQVDLDDVAAQMRILDIRQVFRRVCLQLLEIDAVARDLAQRLPVRRA